MPEIRLVSVDRLDRNQRKVVNHMTTHLKSRPVHTVTPAGDDLSTAYLAGMPLLASLQPDAAFSRSIQAFADVLVSSNGCRGAVRLG
jgi:hypothetical protein